MSERPAADANLLVFVTSRGLPQSAFVATRFPAVLQVLSAYDSIHHNLFASYSSLSAALRAAF